MSGTLVRFILVMSLSFVTVDAAAQQPRDNQRRAVSGTSTITGVVVSAEAQARPVRRARVTISGSELEGSRVTITTDDGRFTFDALPAGSFTVSASKDGYAPNAFGAVRPGRPGRLVSVPVGEVRQLRLALPRGAVITGMVRDPQGDPAPGVTVAVLSRRFTPSSGEQRLVAVPGTNVTTDDRGIYRVFGLVPGSYLVTALPRLPFTGSAAEITAVSRDEVQRALADVQESRTSSRFGMPATSTAPAPPPVRRAALAYAPTYFPGTTSESRATAITVAAGEVRTGADFDLDYVPSVSIEGFVATPSESRVQLVLSKADPESPHQTTISASPDAEGRFSFRRVQPGHYVIAARAVSFATRAILWGRTEVIVAGDDIEGVSVGLEPALTLAGDLVFGGTTTPPSLGGFRLPLQLASRVPMAVPFPVPVVEGSQVVLRGVAPGTYRFTSSPQGIRSRVGPWWLKSITIDDREMLDQPLEIPPNAKSMRVVFSGEASQLSGVVTDRDGAAVSDGYVVVFSEAPKTWFLHSRRVAAVPLKADGRYAVANLPAGNYFVAVSSDLEHNEWFDPERLQALRASAARVTIGENQVVSRNIAIGPKQP